ncbi:MAG: hypothetical protein KIT43_08195 [Bauldia sp.]|nr:hypothetical protein [Bauldia sp.]MCW5716896.1 hypothetical protein [Bauldia sp.]
MAKTPRGRNLFAIDQASIEATLAEANGALISGRNKLLRAFRSIPESLDTVEDIDKAQAFGKDLEELLSEARKARLSDGKPFTEAGKTVKDFFARIEGPLKATMDELHQRVTQAALRQRKLAAEAGAREQPATGSGPLEPRQTGVSTVAKPERGSNIPLVWMVESFDRETIDLQALRPFLSEVAVEMAFRKYLDARSAKTEKPVAERLLLDFWVKILGMLQQNWAFIHSDVSGRALILFVDDLGKVFDELHIANREGAEEGLRRNGFRRFADDPSLAEFLTPPRIPFSRPAELTGPVYSSGQYWIPA